ncbi:hypothetical protein DMH04_41085 [Kibdelosporangium aridum]|uniref:Uncharacterized protein n=1 Tax=Kibdelosporangium aridum TaxID=2030 RepID=A0A428YUV9_KIBAR|nr:hypothetical protein [Kibdelosporangium aridum]RSM73412.1 hypothetical protein DMH04_41085 [Kibdelosporangium aridum]
MHRITTDSLTLEVALGDDDPATVANADAWITLPDGTKWTATFLTHAEVGRIMDRWRDTGECLDGRYFRVGPDLVIIRSPGVAEMLAVATELVATGEYTDALHRVDGS